MSVITAASSFHKTTHAEFLMSFFSPNPATLLQKSCLLMKILFICRSFMRRAKFGQTKGILIENFMAQNGKVSAINLRSLTNMIFDIPKGYKKFFA